MKLEFKCLKEPNNDVISVLYFFFSFIFTGIISMFNIIPSWVFYSLILLMFFSYQLARVRIHKIKDKPKRKGVGR